MRSALCLLLATLLHAVAGFAAPVPSALFARSEGSSPGNWGALPALLGSLTPITSIDDGTLPEGDLSSYRFIAITTDLNAYMPHRQRLLDYVAGGGRLVLWFADDERTDPAFYPYRLELSDSDPGEITFVDSPHPLLASLRGRTFRADAAGGDVVAKWDRARWQVLAQSPSGPAMLLCAHGRGEVLVVQFHGPLSSRADVTGPLAENLVAWAGLPRLDPAELRARSVEEVLLAVARRQMRRLRPGEPLLGSWEQVSGARKPAGLAWSYPWSVTLYGMLQVSAATGDGAPAAFVLEHNRLAAEHYDYLRRQRRVFGKTAGSAGLDLLMRLDCLDDCGAMAAQAAEALLRHDAEPTPELLSMLGIIADYITYHQSRFADGTLCRGSTLWVDDLYMSVPFLARWGTYTGDRHYWNDAARQLLLFSSRLQDEDGLWFHGWFGNEGRPSPCKWGRGNGWAMLSEVAVLSELPQDHPAREALLRMLRHHIQGLRPHQAPSGMWRQVVDEPELWEETSATAMFAHSIARACARGWIEPENLQMAARAVDALKLRITWDGSVLDTCCGTGIGRDLEQYAQRPRPVNDGHGPGPVMLAGAELFLAQKALRQTGQ